MKIPHQRFAADAVGSHDRVAKFTRELAGTPIPHVQQPPPVYGDYLYPGTGIVMPIPSKNHNNYASTIIEPSVMTPFNGDPTDASASSSYPEVGDPTSTAGGLNVRAEEVGLVLLVLMLWAGAVALFFNRWGKIRMLEPYQPKFIDAPRGSLAVANGAAAPLIPGAHRPSYPVIEIAHQQPRLHPHHSRLNLPSSSGACCACEDDHQTSACSASSGRRRPTSPSLHFLHHHQPGRLSGSQRRLSPGMPSYGVDPYQRPRQNSVVVFATAHFMTAARRVKSAMDLQTLVLREETEESVHALSTAGPSNGPGQINPPGGSTSGLGAVPTCHLSEAAITCV